MAGLLPEPRKVLGRLLKGYRSRARDLPWRRTRDPYAIWVSEMMLQQTQVSTVIPYYQRWMAEFPDLSALATAPVEAVLSIWAGLGYYARPRRFREAARQILERFDGEWPSTVAEWESLPGVGPYTAGAVLSIAFNQPVPAIDGNVARVISRIWGLTADRDLKARVGDVAAQLIALAARMPARQGERNCADTTQALMELGATLCAPRRPNCAVCELKAFCRAAQSGEPEAFGAERKRPRPSVRHLRVWILQRPGTIYVRPESGHGWNKGLWQFPTEELPGGVQSSQGVPASRATQVRVLMRITHHITRYRFRVVVVTPLGSEPRGLRVEGGQWLARRSLESFPLSGLHRKIARRIESLSPGLGVLP